VKLFSRIFTLFGAAAVLATTLTFVPAKADSPKVAKKSAPVAVKGYTRKTKTGKVVTVKGYTKGAKAATPAKTVTVKGYTRKTKSGKTVAVKAYTRKVTTPKKPAASHM